MCRLAARSGALAECPPRSPSTPSDLGVHTAVVAGGAARAGSVGHVPEGGWQAGAVEWSPRLGETVALVAVALGLGLALVVLGAPGRLLVGLGALLLLALAVRDVVLRPRLSAGTDGVRVRTWSGRQHLPWADLRVGVRENRRLG